MAADKTTGERQAWNFYEKDLLIKNNQIGTYSSGFQQSFPQYQSLASLRLWKIVLMI